MENVNGSALKWNARIGQPAENEPEHHEQQQETKSPKQKTSAPPAMAFQHGRVMTRVWANPNCWGGVTWRVDQARQIYSGTGNYARSYHAEDLRDAMRGLYAAERWIKKAERRRTRRWFW